MHHRPLALVLALAAGDYLLWNWSVQGSHDVLALVSGLTLPPLAVAVAWLLVVNAGRLLAAQRPRVGGAVRSATRSARPGGRRTIPVSDDAAMALREEEQAGPSARPASSSKLAA